MKKCVNTASGEHDSCCGKKSVWFFITAVSVQSLCHVTTGILLPLQLLHTHTTRMFFFFFFPTKNRL